VFASAALASLAVHPWVGGPPFGFLFLLIPLFWIAVFVVLFATVGRRWRRRAWQNGGRFGQWAGPGQRAEVTLAERFAQGDIDEKEYRARLEVLRANAYPQPPQQ
jgi:putative membrane protein